MHLLVEDGTITAFINGERVLINDLPGYSGGFIGFGCGPFEAPEADCAFDNLDVSGLG